MVGGRPARQRNVPARGRRGASGAPTSWRARFAAFRPAARQAVSWCQRALLAALALAVLVAFVAGTVELRWKERGLRAQVAARTAELHAEERRNEELRGQLAAANPDAYRAWVEDTARRQLNLGYPGETVVLVNWTDPPASAAPPAATPAPTPPTPSAGEPNWRHWLRFLRGE